MNRSGKPISISVIIPTFNRSKVVTRAIDSVLKQTVRPVEIVVIDDGSTDDTESVLQQYGEKILYIKQPNKGVSSARNRGIKEAKGDYIAFLDSDDEWLPDKIEKQVRFLRNHSVSIVITDAVEKNGSKAGDTSFKKCLFSEKLQSGGPVQNLSHMLLVQNFINLSTVMVRKKCFEQSGLFDENLNVTEDTDLWLRLSVDYDFGIFHEITVKRYMEGGNLSDNTEKKLAGRTVILNKILKNGSALDRIGKRRILDQKYLSLGILTYFYIRKRMAGKLVKQLFSTPPGYLFDKMFYKGIYWDYKKFRSG